MKTTVVLDKDDLQFIVGNKSKFIREAILAKLSLDVLSLSHLQKQKCVLKKNLKIINKQIKKLEKRYDDECDIN